MKRIKELKEGDAIFVECPISSNHWDEEIVSKVIIGEDMYTGSGRWYMHIKTNKSISSCSDDMAKNEHKHWPILIKSLGGQVEDVADASPNVQLRVKTSNEKEEE